jgi:threonine dehydratase
MILAMSTDPFTLAALREAHAGLAGDVHRTPLVHSSTLSRLAGRPVYLKCENLQRTGSFKVRGALNRIRALTEDERARGVITISAGNHAQAVAWAAAAAGGASTVVMPERASQTKVRASREYGAEVILHGNPGEAFRRAFELAEERRLAFVHPFDDPWVVAGHAGCMLEVLEELPDMAAVVVPIGGGGLASGIAVAVAAAAPHVDVWGVEPDGAAAMHRSFELGRPVHLDAVQTVADGLGAPMAGELNFELLQRHARGVVRVTDDEIVRAMRLLLERTKLLVEPAGAAGLAALLEDRVPLHGDGPVVVVLSGGNVDLELLARLLVEGSPGRA